RAEEPPADQRDVGLAHLDRTLGPPGARPRRSPALPQAQRAEGERAEPGERFGRGNGRPRERVGEREREARARCKAVVGGEPGPPRRTLREWHETDGVPAERQAPDQGEIAREPETEGEGGRAARGKERQRHVAREVERDGAGLEAKDVERDAARPPRSQIGPQLARDDRPQQRGHEIEARGEEPRRRHRARSSARGSSTLTARPRPLPARTAIRPPCASIVRRAIASPRPVPLGFVEKNGSKRCGSASAGTPGPLSRTSSAAAPCPLATATESVRGPAAPAVMALSAFSSRLTRTWRSFSRSARAVTPSG